MGVIQLWTELREYRDAYRVWNGAAKKVVNGAQVDDTAHIVEDLCGKVLAIDTSVWIFQASQHRELQEVIYDEHARVLMVIFNRILNLLRFGATPVFVLEGSTPEAKMGRLEQRSFYRGTGGAVGNKRGGRHDTLGRRVAELVELMGLPYVEAPGEAEAMCAVLTSCGLADGVVTSDVDALLFGATRVYRECRVQMDTPKSNVVEFMDATEAAKRCFGIMGGGGCMRALQAVACLAGCDYSVSGGKGVGTKTALEAVQQLTKGQPDDSQVLPKLMRYLETGPDPQVVALTKCTGCKTCGHEKHGRQPCPQCGPGPCRPRAESQGCMCAFHRSEPQRKFMRVISRATTTGSSFVSDCKATIAAFESEIQRANQVASRLRREDLSWSNRPDVQGVFDLLNPLLGSTGSDPSRLIWTYAETRDKMRPVLMEWDMRQGPDPRGPATDVVEFRPRRIKRVAAKDGGTWAYIIEFERLDSGNRGQVGFDAAQLVNAKMVKSRHVRQTIIHRLWGRLLELREEEEQAKLAKPKGGRRKAAATATCTGSGGLGSPGGGFSGATGTAAGGTAGRSGAAITVSGASAGSSQVMERWLGIGRGGGRAGAGAGTSAGTGAAAVAAALGRILPTASVQQPLHSQVVGQQQWDVHAGPSGRGAAAAAATAAAPTGWDGDDDYDDGGGYDNDVQMTQRNQQGHEPVAAMAAAAAQPLLRAGPGAAALVPLWGGDDDDDDQEDQGGGGKSHGGQRRRSGLVEGGGSYDNDADDVVPASLDELLAGRGASQASARRRSRGQAAAGAAEARAGPGGEMDPWIAQAPAERPFRHPNPTGPGPGSAAQGRSAGGGGGPWASGAAGGAGGDPVRSERQREGGAARGGGGGGGGGVGGGSGRAAASREALDVEVMDLTDSPAPLVVVRAGTRPPHRSGLGPCRWDVHTGGRPQEDLGTRGGDGGFEGAGNGEADAEDVDEPEAVGSAVKPSVRRGSAGGVIRGSVDAGCGAGPSVRQGPGRALRFDDEGRGERDEEAGPSMGQPPTWQQPARPRLDSAGGVGNDSDIPAERNAPLMRSLFPDRPPPSPASQPRPSLSRKKSREEGPSGLDQAADPQGSAQGGCATDGLQGWAEGGAGPAKTSDSGALAAADGTDSDVVFIQDQRKREQQQGPRSPGNQPQEQLQLQGPAARDARQADEEMEQQVGMQDREQQERMEGGGCGAAAAGVLGSPPKRQNRGGASGSNGTSIGAAGRSGSARAGEGHAGTGYGSTADHGRRAAQQGSGTGRGDTAVCRAGNVPVQGAVDLTLDDSDEEEEEEDVGPGARGGFVGGRAPGASQQSGPAAGLRSGLVGVRGVSSGATAGSWRGGSGGGGLAGGSVARSGASRGLSEDVEVVDLT